LAPQFAVIVPVLGVSPPDATGTFASVIVVPSVVKSSAPDQFSEPTRNW
jgi:hypothetical protein